MRSLLICTFLHNISDNRDVYKRQMLHGVMNTGYLPAVFTMQLPVSAKKPARYRIQLEKLALFTLRPVSYTHLDVYKRQALGFLS